MDDDIGDSVIDGTMPLRVVVVEDRPMEAELIVLRLEADGFRVDWQRVQTAAAYLTALATEPDLVLSDWNLPQFSGADALRLLHERGMDTPFVIVSGTVGEDVAVAAMREGADDYVLKDRLTRLGPAVRMALASKLRRDMERRDDLALRQAATIFECSAEGMTLTDAVGTILTVNPTFCQITGYQAQDVVGLNARVLASGSHNREFFADMWAELAAAGRWQGEIWNRRRSGEVYPQWLTISAVTDHDAVTTHYVGTFSDVSAIEAARQTIEFLGHHDPLTRLPNRALFRERLEQRLLGRRTDDDGVAVLQLGLERFKQINESLGHVAGDEVLHALARRIAGAVRTGDTLGRLGGDAFGLLLDATSDAAAAVVIAAKLLTVCAAPLRIGAHDLVVTVSIGISRYPRDGDRAEDLLTHAERAMYEAKSQGRNTYQFFADTLNAGIHERLELEHALRGAATRGELQVHYQPQISLGDSTLIGVEALVRWQHPTLGLISPGEFIPLAEQMGVIGEIGEWVLDHACGQLAAWQDSYLTVPRVAVNLSVQQLEQPAIVATVAAILARHGLTADRLELEVTESMMIRHPQQILSILQDLTAIGIGLAMDDFGTGYSSLAYLKHIPLTVIKIDMSFVHDIGRDRNGEAIIRAIIALARNLGMQIVAEGIEHETEANFLRHEGCQSGQGYLYGRPVPAAELLAAWGTS